jgi:murein DD-endopeptidase MepM/ murein hydrolase activator NlpD
MNMKDFKEKISQKINKESVKGFFQKQGLYVLIFLCVVAAGITAIVAWPKDTAIEEETDGSDQDVSMIDVPSLEEEMANMPTVRPETTVEPEPTEVAVTDENDDAVPASNGSGTITLKRPLEGQIINDFSGDELVFFASLNVWATHNGIDIKAEEGADVTAAMSGTVIEAFTNEADGGVVVISHADDAETVYAGLGEIAVKKGDKVNAGDKLGKIGEMPTELDLGYHLHFEYTVGGAYKDPAKYF